MAIDILDSLKSAFGSPVTRQVSTIFGDSEEATRSGLRSSFSALLAGVLQKSTTPGGAEDVYRTVTSNNVDPSLPSRVSTLLGNRGSLESSLGAGESMLGSIFGNRTSSVAQAISDVSGVKPASATGLLAMAAPMLMGVLKKQVTQNNLDARGLGSMLLNQRNSLQSAGLDSRITNAMGLSSLQSLFGTGTAREEPRSFSATGNTYTRPDDYHGQAEIYSRNEPRAGAGTYAHAAPDRRRGRWIPWAIAAGLAIAALGFLSTRFGGDRDRTRVAATTGTAAPTATSVTTRVYFDAGRADITTTGQRAISVVASTAKSSTAPVAVTGYADPSGNADQNAELAKNRASAVRDALVREGVPAVRVVMAPPVPTSPGTPPDDSRRVDIRLSAAPDSTGTAR